MVHRCDRSRGDLRSRGRSSSRLRSMPYAKPLKRTYQRKTGKAPQRYRKTVGATAVSRAVKYQVDRTFNRKIETKWSYTPLTLAIPCNRTFFFVTDLTAIPQGVGHQNRTADDIYNVNIESRLEFPVGIPVDTAVRICFVQPKNVGVTVAADVVTNPGDSQTADATVSIGAVSQALSLNPAVFDPQFNFGNTSSMRVLKSMWMTCANPPGKPIYKTVKCKVPKLHFTQGSQQADHPVYVAVSIWNTRLWLGQIVGTPQVDATANGSSTLTAGRVQFQHNARTSFKDA